MYNKKPPGSAIGSLGNPTNDQPAAGSKHGLAKRRSHEKTRPNPRGVTAGTVDIKLTGNPQLELDQTSRSSTRGVGAITQDTQTGARRACEAGFRVIEIHAAHGYLIHEFLSPFSNQKTDAYGGSFENRTRILRETVTAVRGSWPERAPLFVRISATDWIDDGWDIQQSVELARQLTDLGDDLIDCSSGGNVAHEKIPAGPVVKRRLQSRCAGKPTSSRVRTGGRRHHRPRPSARSLLALACGSRARPANFVAGPISQSGLKRLAAPR